MKTFQILYLILFLSTFSCNTVNEDIRQENYNQYITVLGVAQDAGYPQINCKKKCCEAYYNGNEVKKLISCLGLVDTNSNKKWLFDATPDITEQIQILNDKHLDNGNVIDGIFLTHAHIGHYTGLMNLGFESMGAKEVPVYAMPKMKMYLETNGPWQQLVSYKNIKLHELKNDSILVLNKSISVIPLIVPHRDEYSETVGYKIIGKNKSALFIPDINKWKLWDKNIVDEVKKVDYAFLDASFYADGELSRPMSQIPHPFIVETMDLFYNEALEVKQKIYFIHLNHTNPALLESSKIKDSIINLGYKFAREGGNFEL